MTEASELALALAAQVADSLQDIDKLPPQSPTVAAYPPRTKQRVSEMSCFISGPSVASDSSSHLPTFGQPSCFVESSLLVPQVPEGYVVPSRSTLPTVPALPGFSASPGSSSDSADMPAQMRVMMEQVVSQKLTEQTQTLTQSFQVSIDSVRSDLEKEKTERLEAQKSLQERMAALEHKIHSLSFQTAQALKGANIGRIHVCV